MVLPEGISTPGSSCGNNIRAINFIIDVHSTRGRRELRDRELRCASRDAGGRDLALKLEGLIKAADQCSVSKQARRPQSYPRASRSRNAWRSIANA